MCVQFWFKFYFILIEIFSTCAAQCCSVFNLIYMLNTFTRDIDETDDDDKKRRLPTKMVVSRFKNILIQWNVNNSVIFCMKNMISKVVQLTHVPLSLSLALSLIQMIKKHIVANRSELQSFDNYFWLLGKWKIMYFRFGYTKYAISNKSWLTKEKCCLLIVYCLNNSLKRQQHELW